MINEDVIKEILYLVYKVDTVSSKLNNKMSFMNMNYLISNLYKWEPAQLEKILPVLQSVTDEILKISQIIENLEPLSLNLIESYSADHNPED